MKTYGHSTDGMIIITGPNVLNKEITAKIYDIAPTILHILDVPIPRDVDGRVLKEIFRRDSELYVRPISYHREDEKSRIREKIEELRNLGKI